MEHESATGPALVPGTLAWYGALFAAPEQRPVIDALYGLWLEIRRIGEQAEEPLAARMRLAWWHEEIALIVAGRARHPRARALEPTLHDREQTLELLRELLVGAEQELHNAAPEDVAELQQTAFRTAGAPLTLLARALGAPAGRALAVGQQAGLVMHCADVLAKLGPDLRRGRVRLPLSGDTAAALHTDGVAALTPERLQPGVRAVRTAADAATAAALAAAVDPEAAVLRFHRIQLALHRRLLQRAGRALAQGLPHEAIALPPWSRLWIAWRGARRSVLETR